MIDLSSRSITKMQHHVLPKRKKLYDSAHLILTDFCSLKNLSRSESDYLDKKKNTWFGLLLEFYDGADSKPTIISTLIDVLILLVVKRSYLVRINAPQRTQKGDFVMNLNTYAATTNEVLRLLNNTIDILDSFVEIPNLLKESASEKNSEDYLTKESARRNIEYLRGEIVKVERLEVSLAFVGTVKAGKSTCINAIVGYDALPNRALPMTTYPTIVRHTPGQHEAIMHFPLRNEFSQLIAAIKRKVVELQTDELLEKIFPNEVEFAIVESILCDEFPDFLEVYRGRQEIAKFLSTLNDLCRITSSEKVGLEIPSARGPEGVRLPTIEVEFHKLGDSDYKGKLSLLDTPGPNELGQGDRLREIVEEQLAQASAAVLVCNFTTLMAQESGDVRDLFKAYIGRLKERAYVFVNKYDEWQTGDWSENETKEKVSKIFLNSEIPPSRVFPVSARRAFLSNWALREIAINEKLPSPSEDNHTANFGQQSLGDGWEDDIEDIGRVCKKAKTSWKKSLLDTPLTDVINFAAKNAALISLKSAVSRVLCDNQSFDEMLTLRRSAATKESEEILRAIHDIESDLQQVDVSKLHAKVLLEDHFLEFQEYIAKICTNFEEDARDCIKGYFEAGVIPQPKGEQENENSDLEEAESHPFPDFLHWVRGMFRDTFQPTAEYRRFKPSDEYGQQRDFSVSRYRKYQEYRGENHQDQAQQLVERVRTRIQQLFSDLQTQIETHMSEGADFLVQSLEKEIGEEIEPLLEKANERLDEDFGVKIQTPSVELRRPYESVSQSPRKDLIRKRTETYTCYEDKPGWHRGVQRWFGGIFDENWGKKKLSKERDVSRVEIQDLKDEVLVLLGGFQESVKSEAEKFRSQQMKPSVDEYFGSLKAHLEKFRLMLSDALGDKNLEKSAQEKLAKDINQLLDQVKEILGQAAMLDEGFEDV